MAQDEDGGQPASYFQWGPREMAAISRPRPPRLIIQGKDGATYEITVSAKGRLKAERIDDLPPPRPILTARVPRLVMESIPTFSSEACPPAEPQAPLPPTPEEPGPAQSRFQGAVTAEQLQFVREESLRLRGIPDE